jgi:hypothetical protein
MVNKYTKFLFETARNFQCFDVFPRPLSHVRIVFSASADLEGMLLKDNKLYVLWQWLSLVIA